MYTRIASAVITGATALLVLLPSTTAFAAFPSGVALPNTSSIRAIQRTVQSQIGLPIVWDSASGSLAEGNLTLSGHGIGAQTVTIECEITFPPLRIRCTITFEFGDDGEE